MFAFDALCPYCEQEFKLHRSGLEGKEFIQCPYCRRVIKADPAILEKMAIRVDNDIAD
jgi:Zn-finger nucleic acid-binding protein